MRCERAEKKRRTGRQTAKPTDSQAGRKTRRERGGQTSRDMWEREEASREVDRQAEGQAERWGRQTDRQMRQTDRQTDGADRWGRQTGRQTGQPDSQTDRADGQTDGQCCTRVVPSSMIRLRQLVLIGEMIPLSLHARAVRTFSKYNKVHRE